MGFFSKLWDNTKNVFSGVGKFFKSAFSGKNIWKTVAVGATLAFGGAALGYWDSPVLKSINGAWSGKDGAGGIMGKALGSEGWLGKKLGTDTISAMQKELGTLDADIAEDVANGVKTQSVDELMNESNAILNTTPSIDAGSTTISPDFAYQGGGLIQDAQKAAKVAETVKDPSMVEEVWDYAANTPIGKGVEKVSNFADKHPTAASAGLSAIASMMADDPEAASTTYAKNKEYDRSNFGVGDSPSTVGQGGWKDTPSAKIMNAKKVKESGDPLTFQEWVSEQKRLQLAGNTKNSMYGARI